ncbi:MAG TPA: histidine phosphatase family protein [Solirubrobacteraceae bacterium]|nr:histidine phosphatase family protein [Solirubrobacteraceae bacterium]
MPTVYLIRHAQGSFGSEDYDVLSERGREQVAALADGLRARGAGSPARVVSGSLRRQRDTAAALGLRVAVDPRWNEYHDREILVHHGEVPAGLEHHAGDPPLSSREFQSILNGALGGWIDAGRDGPCSETWPAFRARALDALDEVAESLGSGETALVVSSGGVIGAVTAALMGLPDHALIAFNHVSINTGVTKLAVGRSGITVISVNEHGHLERGGGSLVTYR